MLTVTLETARRVIEGVEAKARSIGCPVNIAVVDAGGNLVAHVRMDNARIGAIDIAINKAWEKPINRLWVHTCHFDHPNALGFYKQLGLTGIHSISMNETPAEGRAEKRQRIPARC